MLAIVTSLIEKAKPKGGSPSCSGGTPARRKESTKTELEADLLENPRWQVSSERFMCVDGLLAGVGLPPLFLGIG